MLIVGSFAFDDSPKSDDPSDTSHGNEALGSKGQFPCTWDAGDDNPFAGDACLDQRFDGTLAKFASELIVVLRDNDRDAAGVGRIDLLLGRLDFLMHKIFFGWQIGEVDGLRVDSGPLGATLSIWSIVGAERAFGMLAVSNHRSNMAGSLTHHSGQSRIGEPTGYEV